MPVPVPQLRIIQTPSGPIVVPMLPGTAGPFTAPPPGTIRPDSFMRRSDSYKNKFGLFGEQRPEETNLGYGARNILAAPFNFVDRQMGALSEGVRDEIAFAGDTPTRRAERQQQRQQQSPAADVTPVGPAPRPFNPFAGFRTTSAPGDPRDGGARRHAGRDWAMPVGTPLVAPLDWTVVRRGTQKGYGKYTDVRFADGSEHRYAHMSAFSQHLSGRAGTPFGLSGVTGNATGPSVHVETTIDGRKVDPANYFGAFAAGGNPRAAQMEELAGAFGAAPPPLDESGFRDAMAFSSQAAQAAMQPVSATYEDTPPPVRGAPTPFAAPDFTAGNEAWMKAAPTDPFSNPKEKTKILRQNYLRGMASALASMDWSKGPGLGELFAKLGAGALGGHLHGDEIIRAKQERFDDQMRQYQLATAQRNDGQAQAIAHTANQNIDQMNRHNDQKFGDAMQQWARHAPQIVGGNLITHRVKDGQVTTTVTPITNAPKVAHLDRMAQISLSLGGARNEHARMVYGAAREDARTALAYTMTNTSASPEAQDQAAFLEIANRVAPLVDSGRWGEFIGNPRVAEQVKQQAWAAAGFDPRRSMNGAPTAAQQQQINDYIEQKLIEDILRGGPDYLKRLYSHPAAIAGAAQQAARNRRTTTRTDARGRRSTSTTETAE